MDFKKIIVSKDEERGIVKLTINQPELHNALDKATRRELKSIIENVKDYPWKWWHTKVAEINRLGQS